MITVPTTKIFADLYQDVTLECIFEFHPKGLVWWERQNGKINPDREKKLVKLFRFSGDILSTTEKYSIADYHLNDFTTRLRLTITNVDEADLGLYVCVGRNIFNNNRDRVEASIAVDFIPGTTKPLYTNPDLI